MTRAVEIYLGDYIDRGPKSAQVVEWLLTSPPLGNERICLRGNHEQCFLDFLPGELSVADWRRLGGAKTLESHGISLRRHMALANPRKISRIFLPSGHYAFFHGLRWSFDYLPYFFAHAGVRPDVPLDRQIARDLLWIREAFWAKAGHVGRIVVHGHTLRENCEILANRINIDTDALFSGRLNCLALEEKSRILLITG